MGVQIPAIAEKPLPACGCRKFNLDTLDDHLCTCTAHSGAKKAHDWVVDQLPDLFRTTHKVKTQQVLKIRGQHFCEESGKFRKVIRVFQRGFTDYKKNNWRRKQKNLSST
jgi:hypothetical protein